MTNYKLYINPGPEFAKFIIPYMEKCTEEGLPIGIKIMDQDEIRAAERSDVVNIYLSTPEDTKKAYEILMQVVKENGISLGRKTKEYSISLDQNDTVGLGYDRTGKDTYNSWETVVSSDLIKILNGTLNKNGNLTSTEIEQLKKKSPKEYTKLCDELYKKLNEQCIIKAKEIVGLQEIMTNQPSKSANKKKEHNSSNFKKRKSTT